MNFSKHIHPVDYKLSDRFIFWLVGAFPLCFSTIKGWSNAVSFLLFIVSAFYIIRDRKYLFLKRNRNFWFLVAILCLPFFTEIFAQFGRGHIVWRSVDGPSRFLIATCIFIFISRIDIAEKLPIQLSRGTYASLLLLLAYVLVFKGYYWGDRLATKVSDTNTVAIYAVVFLSVSLLSLETLKSRPLMRVSGYLVGFGVTTYVCYYSQTRGSWVTAIVLVMLILIRAFWSRKLVLTGATLVLIMTILIGYQTVDLINIRVNQVMYDVVQFAQGDPETSVGRRIALKLLDVELLKIAPLFGFEDGYLPSYEILKSRVPILTEDVYSMKISGGSHSEIFAQLTRKGILLGASAVFCLFIYPVYFFWRRRSSSESSVRQIAQVGLITTIVVIITSFAFEVLNLKMTATFWGVFLAVFLGSIHSLETAHENRTSRSL